MRMPDMASALTRSARIRHVRRVVEPPAGRSDDALVVSAWPAVAVQQLLANAHRIGRDFDQLVAVDELERDVDAHQAWRAEDDVFVATGCANVRELLLAGDVHVEIAGAIVLTDH